MLTYAELKSVQRGSTMQPEDLNMTTSVTGYQLFLFVTFGYGKANQELAAEVDSLGLNMEKLSFLTFFVTFRNFKLLLRNK